jgi:hypothetical protein
MEQLEGTSLLLPTEDDDQRSALVRASGADVYYR